MIALAKADLRISYGILSEPLLGSLFFGPQKHETTAFIHTFYAYPKAALAGVILVPDHPRESCQKQQNLRQPKQNKYASFSSNSLSAVEGGNLLRGMLPLKTP